MANADITYITLGQEFDAKIKRYNKKELAGITDAQWEHWHPDGMFHGITHETLSPKADNRLVLLTEDDGDGLPVGSDTLACVRRYWEEAGTHKFPPARTVVRFALFMHQDLYQIIVLWLKVKWERYYAVNVQNWRANNVDWAFLDALYEGAYDEWREKCVGFNPDTKELFNLLEEHGNLAANAGYTEQTFDTLIQTMLVRKLCWVASDSEALERFIQEETKRLELLGHATPEQQEDYWVAQCSLNERLNERDPLAAGLEDHRLRKAETLRKWNEVYGKWDIELLLEINRRENTRIRIDLKASFPDLTREALDEKVQEEEAKRAEELKTLEKEVFLAGVLARPVPKGGGGVPLDPKEVADRDERKKRLLREIARLTFFEKLRHSPVFERLSDKEKEELSQITIGANAEFNLIRDMKGATDIDWSELGIPEGYYGHSFRTVEALERVLDRIREIYNNAGLDVEPGTVPQGQKLEEQIEWLRKQQKYVETDIALIKSELQALLEDSDIQRKRGILDRPELREKIIEDTEKHIAECRAQTEKLEKELEALF